MVQGDRDIVHLYKCMSGDPHLQRDWEMNQPRIDRCLEAPLIVNIAREVATAVLLWLKLRFEPGAREVEVPEAGTELLDWAEAHRKDQCMGGPRLRNLLLESRATVDERRTATASLLFYRDRSALNPLVKYPWSRAGLGALAVAGPDQLEAPCLRLPSTKATEGARAVAAFLLDPPDPVTWPLPKFPGVGQERSDAIGVFGFRKGWPITDKNLWRLCAVHGVLSPEEAGAKGYLARRKAFARHWQALQRGSLDTEPGELAATLYLWANEASRYGIRYW